MTRATGVRDAAAAPASLVAAEFGITVEDRGSSVGLEMADLIEVGLRRNPRRAQLLVSTVLGKHLAADPLVIAGTGRLLGALVARTLADDDSEVPDCWLVAARAAVAGAGPDALLAELDAARSAPLEAVLTFGFAETATSVGHFVADQLRSDYLHSTRRQDGDVPIAADFSEPHSHATGHLLRPDPPELLFAAGTIVLVDDELSTGRTALNVIEALQALAPRARYVLAGLVDVRSAGDDGIRAEVARRLGCRIDVVSLVRGEIFVPTATVDRVAAELAAHEPIPPATADAPAARWVNLPWPATVPQGGRHGFRDADRPAFDDAVDSARAVLSTACGDARRVLVLGTEELMYLPLRLAMALATEEPGGGAPRRQVAFQSTTRSPVHAIDRGGYPIRRRIDFQSRVLEPADEESDLQTRHVYNCSWPTGTAETGRGAAEADLIVIVDDGHAVPGPTGLAASVAAATGVPVLVAVLSAGAVR